MEPLLFLSPETIIYGSESKIDSSNCKLSGHVLSGNDLSGHDAC